jgi:hypothetical protein
VVVGRVLLLWWCPRQLRGFCERDGVGITMADTETDSLSASGASLAASGLTFGSEVRSYA